MSGDAPLSTGLPHKTSVQATAFQQPPNCPLALCATIERGQKELERLNRSEAQLQKALAREQVLLDQKDELIRHKDLMSRESDHRLMNGLQMVSSLLSLQSREAHNTNAAEQLKIAANRVATIGSVHKRLHALDHVRSVELKQYLENLCQDMRGILPTEHAERNLAVEGIALEVPTAIGIPLGYIVSELVTNSAKYANGKITVRLGTLVSGILAGGVVDRVVVGGSPSATQHVFEEFFFWGLYVRGATILLTFIAVTCSLAGLDQHRNNSI